MATEKKPDRVTHRQQVFLNEWVKDRNAIRAARIAGYPKPNVAANRLLDPKRCPLVYKAAQYAIAEEERHAKRSADDIRAYLCNILFFRPADYADPGEDGGWFMDPDKYDQLPGDVKHLIESCEKKEFCRYNSDGQVVMRDVRLYIKFVAKTKALELLSKHLLGDKVEHNFQQLDLVALQQLAASKREARQIESRITEVKQLPKPQEEHNGQEDRSDGTGTT